jgi:hypothetical protein
MLQKLKKRLQNALGVSALNEKVEKLSIEARIASGFSRGAAGIAAQTIDRSSPQSWEFGAFSQHGEDGILEYLIQNLRESDKYFLEIAAGDGLENCTAWLALARKWTGVMVEGNKLSAEHCRKVYHQRIWNVMVRNCYVNTENVKELLEILPSKNFDVFSLDIDSIDYHIMSACVELGYRPKILVVEYNSAFGPEAVLFPEYKKVFDRWREHPGGIYYGASITAWRQLLEAKGYFFLGVESSGTNAFFLHRDYFQEKFLNQIQVLGFLDNSTDMNPTTYLTDPQGAIRKFLKPHWKRQLELMKTCLSNSK